MPTWLVWAHHLQWRPPSWRLCNHGWLHTTHLDLWYSFQAKMALELHPLHRGDSGFTWDTCGNLEMVPGAGGWNLALALAVALSMATIALALGSALVVLVPVVFMAFLGAMAAAALGVS